MCMLFDLWIVERPCFVIHCILDQMYFVMLPDCQCAAVVHLAYQEEPAKNQSYLMYLNLSGKV